jgi:DNA modification methylase
VIKPYYIREGIEIYHGDCLSVLQELPENSIDSIVTDPPYGLKLMGKDWDHGIPGVHFWVEALRVAKPGAYLLAFGGTRTFHRLTCAIEDAGWEIRDCLGWLYGSGFPKSHDVSKGIDKAAGAERPREKRFVGTIKGGALHAGKENGNARTWNDVQTDEPQTDAAKQWDGWGTSLKPAWESIILARKPLIGTVVENVLKHGTGGINIDGCRVDTIDDTTTRHNSSSSYMTGRIGEVQPIGEEYITGSSKGRWPANIILSDDPEVLAVFPETTSTTRKATGKNIYKGNSLNKSKTLDTDDRGFIDSGSAARFFYCAKASKHDRDDGCDGMEKKFLATMGDGIGAREHNPEQSTAWVRNNHPTVKPTSLMRYLCRLITPPKGTVLDNFMGSGSTGKAAILEGFKFIGIEKEIEYAEIAKARCERVLNQGTLEL